MEKLVLQYKSIHSNLVEINLPASKSLSNRFLILKNRYFPELTIENCSTANDTQLLKNLLANPSQTYNAEDAGTTFRFLTALLASQKSDCLLTGTERMKQRPIHDLVILLRQLGAEITYLEKEGFPPIHIKGKSLVGGIILKSESQLSSQFHSALALIAPSCSKGLSIQLPEKINSRPYWEMTLGCMKNLGIKWTQTERNQYFFPPFKPSHLNSNVWVENDWSAASFFILLPLLVKGLEIILPGLNMQSLQGDAHFLQQHAQAFGLEIKETENGIKVKSTEKEIKLTELNFSDAPDLSLNFIVVLALLKKVIKFSGLESLAIKESDRTQAIQTELSKIGVLFTQEENHWKLNPKGLHFPSNLEFHSYKDHRIAMALSYVSIFTPFTLFEPNVVKKSYPDFWKEIAKIGMIG